MDRRLDRRAWRVGASLVVTVPKAEVTRLGLRAGDLVGVTFTAVDVRVRAPDIAVAAMDALVARLTPALMRLRAIDGGAQEAQVGDESEDKAWLLDWMK